LQAIYFGAIIKKKQGGNHMKISAKKERDIARESVIATALELFATKYEDVMLTESNQFCFPLVGVNGTELYGRVTISIPTGSKGEPFNGYELAKDYVFRCEEVEAKAKAKAEEKKNAK
jgi:hypothetical protein